MGKYQPLSSSSASVLFILKERAQLHSPWPLQPSLPCCCCPDFYFPLCLRILRVPAPGTAALGYLPKGLMLAFALPNSCFIGLGASVPHRAGSSAGSRADSRCILQPCLTDLHRLV